MLHAFTLDSIHEIFEIGNEVFMKNNQEEIDKITNRPRNSAPDLMDDEPFSFDRALEIFQRLNGKYNEVSPELIERVFEINSQLAWDSYRKRYTEYILSIYKAHPDNEYLNYLAAIILYDSKAYYEALRCVNIAISYNPSSANYTHLKALCFIQLGEFESAHTYLYQALFLVEVVRDVPPKIKFNSDIYPNYPIEFHTNAQLIRGDLKKIEHVDDLFRTYILPILE
jgi:tetratricopeptide (TPR) repeat protein